MKRNYQQWHSLKANINERAQLPSFRQKEIWWCHVGANIGHESDGKGNSFSRPVLVVRKFNRHIFLGAPLSTQIKQTPYYHKVRFKNRDQCVMLTQIRIWDSKRLLRKMGKLPDNQFTEIHKAIKGVV